jgi:hypothetical protein
MVSLSQNNRERPDAKGVADYLLFLIYGKSIKALGRNSERDGKYRGCIKIVSKELNMEQKI